MRKLFSNLTFWVLIAITAGILVGRFAPQFALQPVLKEPWKYKFLGQDLEAGVSLSEFLSKGFISIIKLFINPIIFLTITLGIIGMGDLKKTGRVGLKALLYFEVVTTFALIIGIGVAILIQPGSGVDTHNLQGDISKYTKPGAFNWVNSTIIVLFTSIIIGIALNFYKRRQRVADLLQVVSKYVFKIFHYVMYLAPIGAFGAMAFTIGKFGVSALLPLAKLMISVYCTMAIFIFFVLWLMLRRYKVSIFRYLKYIRRELLVVFGTSSSEAGLPLVMEKLETMGCARPIVRLVVPTGYSFNLDGTAIYLSMCMIFLAQVFHIHLDFLQVLSIIGILMLTSKGAAGVTGSGFIILASTITATKIMPVEGLALLLGVDRFMSEARAITNFIGNGVATIWISNNEKEFDRGKMEKAFEGNLELGIRD